MFKYEDKYILLSGGFDPVHVGHVRMMRDAWELGYKVIIALNSDAWLMRKKGYIFMPWDERKEILEAIDYVHEVVAVDDEDNTVCKAIIEQKISAFGNGGDRKQDNTPEVELCEKLKIGLVWNLGGGKVQSSSELVKNAEKVKND